jgi:hypothetical protein
MGRGVHDREGHDKEGVPRQAGGKRRSRRGSEVKYLVHRQKTANRWIGATVDTY